MSFLADGGFDRNRTSVADRVLRDLESSILSGRLEKGAKLPSEKELASYYGVSSPTIREAIRANGRGHLSVGFGSEETLQ